MGIDRRHRHVDETRMAVPVRRVQGDPARQAPQFRQDGVDPAPVVQIEQRQPELPPARNRDDPFGLQESQRPFDQRIVLLDAERSRSDIDQGGHKEVRRRVLVQAPGAAFKPCELERAQHATAPAGRERLCHDAVQQHVLRGQHGTPDHLAFPGAIFALQSEQTRACTVQRRSRVGRLELPRANGRDLAGH